MADHSSRRSPLSGSSDPSLSESEQEDEAPAPIPFDAPADLDTRGGIFGPARPHSPVTEDGPPSSDDFSDEGVGFVASPGANHGGQGQHAGGSASHGGNEEEGVRDEASRAASQPSAALAGTVVGYQEGEDEGISFDAPPMPAFAASGDEEDGDEGPRAVDDDEAISFAPSHVPLTPHHGNSAGLLSLDDDDNDDEAISFGAPTVPHAAPYSAAVGPVAVDEDEISSLDPPPVPPRAPRPGHVSLNQILHQNPIESHSLESIPQLPRPGVLDPRNMAEDDEGVSPDVTPSEPMDVDTDYARFFGAPLTRVSAFQSVPMERDTPMPGADDEDAEFEYEDEDEVVPQTPSPAAMEQVRRLSDARLRQLARRLNPRFMVTERGRRFSEPTFTPTSGRELSQSREEQVKETIDSLGNPPLVVDPEDLPPSYDTRQRLQTPERIEVPSEVWRTSTTASEPSSLLSSKPWSALRAGRQRRASATVA